MIDYNEQLVKIKIYYFMKYIIVIILIVVHYSLIGQNNSVRQQSLEMLQQADNMLRFGGDVERVLILYGDIIQSDPSSSEAYMKRANLLTRLGRTNEAMRDYNMSLTLNPKSAMIYDYRAKLKILQSS